MNDNSRERRQYPRHEVRFFVLDHSVEGGRVLQGLNFSKGGMRLRGKARHDFFKVTISIPHDDTQLDVEVKKVYQNEDIFGVQFVAPSPELIEKIDWWG